MKIKAVLWDMDGVIIDSEKHYMAGTLIWMKKLGYQGDLKQLSTIIGTTMEITYKMLEEMLDYKYSISELAKNNELYFQENPLDYNKIKNEGVDEVLKYLKENNIKAALCSSSPLHTIMNVLKVCHIEKYFDYIVSGDQFKQSKPNPEIYISATNKLNVSIEQCLVVEDSNMGIAVGKNAGIYTVALKEEMFSIDQSEADVIISSLSEVIDIIKSSNY